MSEPDFGWEGQVSASDSEDDTGTGSNSDESGEDETPSGVQALAESGFIDDRVVGTDKSDEADTSESEAENAKPTAVHSPEDDPYADLAGESLTPVQARSKEHRRRVLIWGPPGVGKTHMAYTAPEPIAIIDTEGKAHDIADKFPDTRFRIWQPEGYQDVLRALDEVEKWLGAWYENEGVIGTIVIDSMSIMWEWAQQQYVADYYPMKDPSEVNLKGGIATRGESDWKKIKEYHNEHFRKRMIRTPYHLVWTAMRTEDYSEMLDNSLDAPPDKPAGEKENPFKVNYILHVDRQNGIPVAVLEKSGLTQHTFVGLEWPTLPEVFDIVEDIKAAELAPESVSAGEVTDYDVRIIEGVPGRLRGVEADDE